jgi:hypothetical protein
MSKARSQSDGHWWEAPRKPKALLLVLALGACDGAACQAASDSATDAEVHFTALADGNVLTDQKLLPVSEGGCIPGIKLPEAAPLCPGGPPYYNPVMSPCSEKCAVCRSKTLSPACICTGTTWGCMSDVCCSDGLCAFEGGPPPACP